MHMHTLDDIPCGIEPNAVFKKLHLTPDDELGRELAGLISEATRAARPKVLYKTVYVEARDPESITLSGTTFRSAVLASCLEDVERAFLYICTCGPELDAVPLGDDAFMAPYCLDVIKAMALGTAIRYLQEHLQDTYQPGKLSSMSPGSGPRNLWPIEEQHALFGAFDGAHHALGVTLTPSCLMVPNKTVSGILYPSQIDFVSCRLCPRTDCPRRRAPFEEHLRKD